MIVLGWPTTDPAGVLTGQKRGQTVRLSAALPVEPSEPTSGVSCFIRVQDLAANRLCGGERDDLSTMPIDQSPGVPHRDVDS